MVNHPLAHIGFFRFFIVRPRLALCALVAMGVFFLLPQEWRMATRLVSAGDVGMALYLALAFAMMARADDAAIRQRAALQDEGGGIILCLTVLGAGVSLAAIMHELAMAKNLSGFAAERAVALAAATVLLSWVFMQTVFALHYAHSYYNADAATKDGGLDIPGKPRTPDYWDFVYFSFIIGTSAQTADVNITGRQIRHVALLHCVTMFFFNTTILALAINIGAGLV